MKAALPRIQPRVRDVNIGGVRSSLQISEIELGGEPRGAALVLCDAGQLQLETIETQNRLAAHGYVSLAADLFGSGRDSSNGAIVRDLDVLLRRMAERGWEPHQIGVIGYGLGGHAALLTAAEVCLGAAVSVIPAAVKDDRFGGLPRLAHIAAPVRTPWLGLFGGYEVGDPKGALKRLADRLYATSPVYSQVVSYPGVEGFFYHGAADAVGHAAYFDSWERTVEWLNLRVAPPATPLAAQWARRAATKRPSR